MLSNFSITSSTTVTASATAQVITVNAASGTTNGVPWSIQVGSVLSCDIGNSAETVIVTAVSGLNVSGIFSKSHSGTWPIWSFVYNQGRDAAGELDGATGSGTAIAVNYNYNNGGPGNSNYDRARNLQGKGIATANINTATIGATSLSLTTAPAGLQQGQPLFLCQSATNLLTGTTEVVYVASSYVPGSTTIPLRSAIANNGHTVALWDTYAVLGPASSKILPSGIGIEAGVVYDPVTGMYGEEFAYTEDNMTGSNIESVGLMGYNGSNADRLRVDAGTTGVLRVTTGGSATYAIAAGVSTNTVIKGSAGRLCRVLVTTENGNSAVLIYDSNSTTITSQTIVGVVPAGSPLGLNPTFDMWCVNGITVVGNAGNPAITVSYY